MRSPALRLAALSALALAAASCFEPPVTESLLLEFLPEGLVTVTVSVRIRDIDDKNPALRRRVEEARRAALEGTDDWSRRFAAFEPKIERGAWEKDEGRLVRSEHSGTTDDPEALGRFFADTGVAVDWRRNEGRNELSLYPPAIGNANRQERQQVERALATWSASIAAYLERAGELWRYLDEHPDRARACLARVFSNYIPDEDVKATGPLTSDETELVDRLDKAMQAATSILEVAAGEAYSLDEMSRHLYDPFPAPIEIALPSPILESEGFTTATAAGDSHLHAGGTSLWQALRNLENRWITPDPMLALVEHDLRRTPDQPFDLAGFLSHERHLDASPTAAQITEALTAHLEPPTTYRVVWLDPTPPSPAPESEENESASPPARHSVNH
jgi:hypothetical protein